MALNLKSAFTTAGIPVEKTGNLAVTSTYTIVKIKDSVVKSMTETVRAEVNNIYPSFVEEVLPENDQYDVLIIIGGSGHSSLLF